MSSPGKAIESPGIGLTPQQIALLNGICDRTLNAHPELTTWIRTIPISKQEQLRFLPIRCFRLFEVSRFSSLALNSAETAPWEREFLSSGSTNSNRAKHHMSSDGLSAYRESACEGLLQAFERFGIPKNVPILSLVPPQELWRDSSLSAMLSFWKEAGFDVHFVPLDKNEDELERAIKKLRKERNSLTELVIFGTSLHHLQVNQWQKKSRSGKPFISVEKVWCFDTGGTKGRTQHVEQHFLYSEIKAWFFSKSSLSILSEYGMCELASQSYSLKEPHENFFRTSEKLRVVSISPDLNHTLPDSSSGFLGFIDLANLDSWPCIITEDLGFTIGGENRDFKLEGRAPDATIKGCSLNVQSAYRFDLKAIQVEAIHHDLQPNSPTQRALFSSEDLLQNLEKDYWTPSALEDLSLSLESWANPEHEQRLVSAAQLKNESIAVIASANIPITWLFPAAHAWMMSAETFDLYLPSIRQDDPISTVIRHQIESLAKAFNTAARFEFIKLRLHRLSTENPRAHANRIMIFGTNDTIATISSEFARQRRKSTIIALGNFQNEFKVQKTSEATSIAKLCSRWFGRGCLTPINIIVPSNLTPEEKTKFVKTLFDSLCVEFEGRLREFKNLGIKTREPFAHQHNISEILGWSQLENSKCSIHRSVETSVTVVDLIQSKEPSEFISRKLAEFGGCGWVNVCSEQTPTRFPCENPTPGLWDTHQGLHWRDWFFKTKTIAE